MSNGKFISEGCLTASGAGVLKDAYKKLLFNICTSGVVLQRIEIIPIGILTTLIKFTVEGSEPQVESFRREFNG